MRLNFRSLILWDHHNIPKPIPHCSNFKKNHFSQKRPILQFIHNIEHDMWTTYGLPAQEFLLYIDFDNTAYVEGGEYKSKHTGCSQSLCSNVAVLAVSISDKTSEV